MLLAFQTLSPWQLLSAQERVLLEFAVWSLSKVSSLLPGLSVASTNCLLREGNKQCLKEVWI